jgi:hypothetical protein
MPQLLERAGTGEKGSITGLYTVLVEVMTLMNQLAIQYAVYGWTYWVKPGNSCAQSLSSH